MHDPDETMIPTRALLKKDSVVFQGTAGVGAGAGVARASGAPGQTPSIAVVYEDDLKQILEVTCRCGERLRILCQFGAAARQAPHAS